MRWNGRVLAIGGGNPAGELPQHGPEEIAHGGKRGRRYIDTATELLGNRNDARRQRGPRDRIEPQAVALHPQDFGGAATDVEDQCCLCLCVNQWFGAHGGKPGFRLAVDDLEAQAGFLAHPVDEFRSVRRHAAGFRRHQPHTRNLPPFQLVGTNPQRIDGAVHRVIAQTSGLLQFFAQANNARKRIDNAEPAARVRADHGHCEQVAEDEQHRDRQDG